MRVVEAALPQVVLLENVKGLGFSGKDEGVRSVKRAFRRINKRHGTKYKAQILLVNAADYGVPQIRERLFIVAATDGSVLELPPATHSSSDDSKPYRTAWDAIGSLDRQDWAEELGLKGRWAKLLPSIPEGKNYLWHTPSNTALGAEPLFGWRTRYWSFLLKLSKHKPAWTIQAQPGPATGPFHWRNRLLSRIELCRLQTFPPGYRIVGSEISARSQIGNAVPSAIGELFGLEIRRQFFGERVRRKLSLIPTRRKRCPRATRPARVPKHYLELRGEYENHPGPGLGPGAVEREKKRDRS